MEYGGGREYDLEKEFGPVPQPPQDNRSLGMRNQADSALLHKLCNALSVSSVCSDTQLAKCLWCAAVPFLLAIL